MSTADVIAERREKISALILGHYSLRAISGTLQIPLATVHRDVVAIRIEWREHRLRALDEVAAEELQRLKAAEKAIWTNVVRGDLRALFGFLKIQERRAKLLGLDAPEQVDILLRTEAKRIAEHFGLTTEEVLGEADRILAGGG